MSPRNIDVSAADDVGPFKALLVTTTAGDIAIIDDFGTAVVMAAVPVGTVIFVSGSQVTKVGTDAVGILAFN